MLNTSEAAIFTAKYVDNYLDSVEHLPTEVQLKLSRLRDIDIRYRGLLRDVDHYYDLWTTAARATTIDGESQQNRLKRYFFRMQHSLIQAQELGDDKMQIVTQIQELIDNRLRNLDLDKKNLAAREELQSQYQFLPGEDCLPSTSKFVRAQSPCRSDYTTNSNNGYGSLSSMNDRKEQSTSGYGGYIVTGACSSTTNNDRMGSSGASSSIGSTAGNSNHLSGGAAGAAGAGKRSRRRNETITMELGGNESNSANENGSNGGGGGAGGACPRPHTGAIKKTSTHQNSSGSLSGAGGASGSGVGTSGNTSAGKKKKRKARGAANAATVPVNAREETPPPDPIDPDEPTYCVCNQISFGEMILCDNDLCPIEWFHFSCVSLVLKPKGKWYCPNCRGDRPNVMKPKAQFLKELERYNKEKEEKT